MSCAFGVLNPLTLQSCHNLANFHRGSNIELLLLCFCRAGILQNAAVLFEVAEPTCSVSLPEAVQSRQHFHQCFHCWIFLTEQEIPLVEFDPHSANCRPVRTNVWHHDPDVALFPSCEACLELNKCMQQLIGCQMDIYVIISST